jgi:translation initiation factor 3 subunit E
VWVEGPFRQEGADLGLAEYDLTTKMAPYLEPQLVMEMLSFLEHNKVSKPSLVVAACCEVCRFAQIHPEKDILKARLGILSKLHNCEETWKAYEQLHGPGSAPASMKDDSAVVAEFARLNEAAKPLIDLIDPSVGEPIDKDSVEFTLENLGSTYGITEAHVQALFDCAKFTFDCALPDLLDQAAMYLYHYRLLVPSNSERALAASWGKMAAEVLCAHYDEADSDHSKIRALIAEVPLPTKALQLQQRVWWLHWGLFVFFNKERGLDQLVSTLLADESLDAIMLCAPWLLRYVAAALILRREPLSSSALRSLLRVIEMDESCASDPIISFLRSLLGQFDFDLAQGHLRECKIAIRSDFFFGRFKGGEKAAEAFVDAARHMLFEAYCRLHRKVDLKMLAEKLGLGSDDAEEWVVKMMRKAHLDARIDTIHGRILMSVDEERVTPQQQVLDRTADLVARTFALQRELEGTIRDVRRSTGRSGRGNRR